MKILIVEDDFASRMILKEFLLEYGDCDIAVNGVEAVKAFRMAHAAKSPYQLITMDIMMPEMDGMEALRIIREEERKMLIPPEYEVKVVMMTALNDPKSVMKAFYESGATSYIVKPVVRAKLKDEFAKIGIFQK